MTSKNGLPSAHPVGGAPQTVADQEDDVDPSVEVARWLREVGRRRWSRARTSTEPCAVTERGARPRERTEPSVRRALLLGLLAVLLLHYVYADTAVEILSLPSLLVFVFAG